MSQTVRIVLGSIELVLVLKARFEPMRLTYKRVRGGLGVFPIYALLNPGMRGPLDPRCPSPHYVTGGNAQLEPNLGSGDDSALNGITFRCDSGSADLQNPGALHNISPSQLPT